MGGKNLEGFQCPVHDWDGKTKQEMDQWIGYSIQFTRSPMVHPSKMVLSCGL